MSTILWLILIIAIATIISKVAKANGFKVFTTSGDKPRFAFLAGLFASSVPGKKGPIATWWNNLDSESSPGQQFVVMVIALLLAYAELHIAGSVWVALGFLLIAAVYKPPKSKITKVFLYLDLGVIILVAFFGGFAKMRHESIEIIDAWGNNGAEAMASYKKSLKEKKLPPVNQAPPQTAATPAVYQPETRRKKVIVTQNEFTEVQVPPGAVASFDCPYGAIARYYYTINGGPLQKEDHDCVEPINIAELGLVSNFRIAFSSKTEVPQEVEYKITF